ncbi:MAG: hypothetical protein M3511_00070 [Deinococcota bacterium]|jgi:hypothetical protein|nr:hypothetical protein [Deinococcota bacterium]
MLAESERFDTLLDQIEQLSPVSRLRLIQRTIQSLIPPAHTEPSQQFIRFGEFAGAEASMSSLEDFTIAELLLSGNRPTNR